MSVAAYDVQQLEEALALPAEPAAFDEQPVGIQALLQGAARPVGSAEAAAVGQSEGLGLTLPGSPLAQVRNLANCTSFDC